MQNLHTRRDATPDQQSAPRPRFRFSLDALVNIATARRPAGPDSCAMSQI
jgi:hypothetical protein